MRRFGFLLIAVFAAITGLLAAQKASAAQDTTLTLMLNQPGVLADYYVDGQLVASQTTTVQVSALPNKWHKIEAKNISDPAALGIYRWKDAVKRVYTSAGSTKTVKLALYKQYLKGFFKLTCKIKNPPSNTTSYCDPTIDGKAVEQIRQGGSVTYTLDPGQHTVVVTVGPHVQWITPQPPTLTVHTYAGITNKQIASPSLYMCDYAWTIIASAGTFCATGPAVTSHVVIEYFEKGIMLWSEPSGVYKVLSYTKSGLGNTMWVFNDPLNPTQDSSGSVGAPPEGMYAPVNGFGSIWRGDVANSAGLRDQFGWATTPESGYEANSQCGSMPYRPNTVCYTTLPDGRLLWVAYANNPIPFWGIVQ